MNKYPLSQKIIDAFLSGNHQATTRLAHKFMVANNYSSIKNCDIDKFLGGWTPSYLHAPGEGWGMSTMDAIRCLYDFERTATFIKGIYKATLEIRRRYSHQEIVAIDAGCGTGIIAVSLAFSGADKVIGIDINPDTVDQAERFIYSIGLSDKVKIQLADATTFNPEKQIHIIHSENLYTGLIYEPQIQILNNLKQYLHGNGLILPESIVLRMSPIYINWDKVSERRTYIEQINIQPDSITYQGPTTTLPLFDFNKKTLLDDTVNAILQMEKHAVNGILVEMDVNVFDSVYLKSGQAKFLGTPEIFKVSCNNFKGNEKVVISYKAGGSPPKHIYPYENES